MLDRALLFVKYITCSKYFYLLIVKLCIPRETYYKLLWNCVFTPEREIYWVFAFF